MLGREKEGEQEHRRLQNHDDAAGRTIHKIAEIGPEKLVRAPIATLIPMRRGKWSVSR